MLVRMFKFLAIVLSQAGANRGIQDPSLFDPEVPLPLLDVNGNLQQMKVFFKANGREVVLETAELKPLIRCKDSTDEEARILIDPEHLGFSSTVKCIRIMQNADFFGKSKEEAMKAILLNTCSDETDAHVAVSVNTQGKEGPTFSYTKFIPISEDSEVDTSWGGTKKEVLDAMRAAAHSPEKTQKACELQLKEQESGTEMRTQEECEKTTNTVISLFLGKVDESAKRAVEDHSVDREYEFTAFPNMNVMMDKYGKQQNKVEAQAYSGARPGGSRR